MTQDLNKDCFVEGEKFTVSAKILLLDQNDTILDCDASAVWGVGTDGMSGICPTMSLRITSGSITEDIDIGSVPDTISQQWNNIFGHFVVTADMAKADLVSIYFRKVDKDISIVVDNLSATKVESSESLLVNNGDFSAGDARYYNAYGGGRITIGAPGYDDDLSMMITNRISEEYGTSHALDSKHLLTTEVYKISCQIFLTNEDFTDAFYCDPTVTSGDTRCPTISLRTQNIGSVFMTRVIASSPAIFQPGEWNTFMSLFQFLEVEVQADSLYLIINNAPKDVVMVIDNVEIYKPNLASDLPSSLPSTSLKPSLSPSLIPSLHPTALNSTIQG